MGCGFQKLEGRATPEGLWLESTVSDGGKFRLVAQALSREVLDCGSPLPASAQADPLQSGRGLPQSKTLSRGNPRLSVAPERVLPTTGTVSVADKLVRFTRPGVTEDYSVSVDGVRQDFVIAERPAGAGDLRVELALRGARAEAAAYGAKVILEGSGRALAYSRLRAADATGKQLTARLEVLSLDRLAVLVADTDATYPVRIDPTFSDANWVSLNPEMPGADGSVKAIVADGSGNVYVGGYFTAIGTVVANCIAKWNGSAWSVLDSGVGGLGDGDGPYVNSLACDSSGNVYVGGSFSTAGGVTANCIAVWNGSAWSALGSGMDGVIYPCVHALAVSGTTLYAGGYFATAGGANANCIARWNGCAWSALGRGMDNDVLALAVIGTTLYAGGSFYSAGEVRASIAAWNGSNWSALDEGIGGGFYTPTVYALAVSGTNLYVGGHFTAAGAGTANNIAAWNGSNWSAVGLGMNGGVSALAVSGTAVYAGGDFTTAGGVGAYNIAAWNGSTWSALGSGINGPVLAVAVNGTNLYVGGNFTKAGGMTANYIAAWNGSTWSGLGEGIAGSYPMVYALAASGSNLYVGGQFSTAGGVPANNIATWNGSAWSALGSGIGGPYPYVYALAVTGTTLYAGGWFTTAGVVTASAIAAWDGSAWSALGSGMSGANAYTSDPIVFALAVSGSILYAGGNFTNAGGVAANDIAAWNGSAWSALGSGMGGSYPLVSALAVSGTNLYAGGGFTTAGGVAANYIAAWDGSAWSALGSGMGGVNWPSVSALACDRSGHLFVGGQFSLAGTNLSPFIAQANIGAGVSVSGGQFGSPVYSPASGFSCTFSNATTGQPYSIETSPSLARGSWTNLTNFTYTGPIVISDRSAATGPKKFYRAVSP